MLLWSWVRFTEVCPGIARELKNSDLKAVTDGRRIFTTTLFNPSRENKEKVEKLFDNIRAFNVDVPKFVIEQIDTY